MRQNEIHRVAGIVCVGSILLSFVSGCGGYGEVSPAGYDYATALYSICNRRDEARLESFASMLAEARSAGEVTPTEADWLEEIADQARAGEWEEATGNSRRLLLDQVEGGP